MTSLVHTDFPSCPTWETWLKAQMMVFETLRVSDLISIFTACKTLYPIPHPVLLLDHGLLSCHHMGCLRIRLIKHPNFRALPSWFLRPAFLLSHILTSLSGPVPLPTSVSKFHSWSQLPCPLLGSPLFLVHLEHMKQLATLALSAF